MFRNSNNIVGLVIWDRLVSRPRETGILAVVENSNSPRRRPRAPRAAMRVLAMVDCHANAWVIMAERIDARRSPRGPAHHCL